MPDGLELFPLDGGKLEIVQELFELSTSEEEDGGIGDDELGEAVFFLYASKYNEVKDLEIEELARSGRELGRSTTLEDRQAAEEVIVADFDALQASMVSHPKVEARKKEERNHSDEPLSSGRDLISDTQEPTSTESQQLKLSKQSLPTLTQTGQKATRSSGQSLTANQ